MGGFCPDYEIPHNSYIPIVTQFSMTNSILLYDTDYNEIIIIIMSLRNSTPGFDFISMDILKIIKDSIISPLVYLVNLSFEIGSFPRCFNLNTIIPIFKKGCTLNTQNYRPIIVIPSIIKIFEKVYYSRLMNYIDKYHIIHKHQYAFKKNLSTTDAIVHYHTLLTDNLDRSNLVVSLALDLSSAFDSVAIKILINKLYNFGIRDKALNWIASYLQQRRYVVKIGNRFSSPIVINKGIPQGTVLGLMMILLFRFSIVIS